MARGRGSKAKRKPGTWVDRDMYTSLAFVNLPKTAYPILMQFLSKRKFVGSLIPTNKNNITVTYKELEAIGMKGKTTISNGFSALLEHGFIKVISQGGARQGEKSIYGLADEWEHWKPGDDPVRVRQKGNQLGSDALSRYRESKKKAQE